MGPAGICGSVTKKEKPVGRTVKIVVLVGAEIPEDRVMEDIPFPEVVPLAGDEVGIVPLVDAVGE